MAETRTIHTYGILINFNLKISQHCFQVKIEISIYMRFQDFIVVLPDDKTRGSKHVVKTFKYSFV